MALWQLEVTTDKDTAFSLIEWLSDECLASSIFEDQDDNSKWIVKGTFASNPDADEISLLVKTVANGNEYLVNLHELPEIDWLAENRKSFAPLEIAGFYIYGSLIEEPIWGQDIPLKIDASTAFGTGNHGTTHGCLAALQQLQSRGFAPKNPLDIGCGTGILALAIAKLFKQSVTATDMDQDAVDKTVYNARENNVQDLVNSFKAEGLDHPKFLNQAFDLIVANILAGPLMDIANDVKNVLAPGGYLILSGILDTQAQAVKECYIDTHLELVSELPIDEWVTIVFKKEL